MLLLSALVAHAAIVFAPIAGPDSTRRPPAADSADAARAAVDTVTARLDTGVAAADTAPPAYVTLDFGGDGRAAPIVARGLEYGVTSAPGATSRSQPVTTARVRFVRAPDSLSAELARRVASGERIASVDARLEGRSGAPGVVVHLYEAQVVSTRLQMNDDNVALLQQRLALEESIAQIGTDLEEARRQLTVAESLDKRHLASTLEVARAHGSADALAARLAVQRERLALVSRQLARWSPVQEEVVLTAARTSLETR